MENSKINPGLLKAYETLQRAWQSGQQVEITISGGGVQETFPASQQVVHSFRTGLGAEALGMTQKVDESIRINEAQAATLIGVPQGELRKLVSEATGRSDLTANSFFSPEDLIPVIAHRQEAHTA